MREIRSAAELHGVRELRNLRADTRQALESKIARILKVNVLRAFHKSKPDSMPYIFSWDGNDVVEVTAAARTFICENRMVLESVANLWWARYLEKVNLLAPLVIEKVERNGAHRSSLSKFLTVIRQTDGPYCFYCDRELAAGRSVHIDHVIPWSFLLSDPLWDLVLACQPCNLSKSDSLPQRQFLDKLALLHVRRAKITLPPGYASPILHREEVDQFYEAALSVEWPAKWLPKKLSACTYSK